MTVAELEYDSKRRTRQEILEKMEGLIPSRIEPFYAKAGRGRRPYPLGVMLRDCVQFYNLSSAWRICSKVESVQPLCGSAPERSLCRTRRLLRSATCWRRLGDGVVRRDPSGEILGHRLKTGTIVDASIIDAPSSTKNRRGERDPEMHQTEGKPSSG